MSLQPGKAAAADAADAADTDTGGRDVFGALGPIVVTRLADRVVEEVRDLILAEDLAVGSRLPSERNLAERFGTSRAIVSQALRTLSLMGLVEIRPGSGAFVTRNPETMFTHSMQLLSLVQEGGAEDVAELRYWLESVGAMRALDRITDAGLDGLAAALTKMSESAGRTSAWVAADTNFHASLVAAAGNAALTALYESIHNAAVSVNYDQWVRQDEVPGWLAGDNLQHQIELHTPILEAVRQRDQDALNDALALHHQAILEHLHQQSP